MFTFGRNKSNATQLITGYEEGPFPKFLERSDPNPDAAMGQRLINPPVKKPLDPVREVALWILDMPHGKLKMIAEGLTNVAGEKHPETFENYIEILHTWALMEIEGAKPPFPAV